MPAEWIGIGALAALFALFGLLRPAERGETACGGCAHAGEGCEGGRCPLMEDLW